MHGREKNFKVKESPFVTPARVASGREPSDHDDGSILTAWRNAPF